MTPGVEAAVEIAEGYGLRTVEPLVLQDTNNTVVWLRPHPVVAKVATEKQTRASVIRERDVCDYLVSVGAPVRPPWRHAPTYHHGPAGDVVSLWQCLRNARSGLGP